MIDWFYQSVGKLKTGTGLRYPLLKDRVMWIKVTNPSEKEIDRLSTDFKIPRKKFDTYMRERRSTTYTFKPFIFTLVDYYLEKEKIKKTNILYVVGKNFVITISAMDIPPYEEAYKMIQELAKTTPLTTGRMLYEILDENTEENFDFLEIIDDQIIELERNITIKGKTQESIIQVIELKRKLVNISKVFWSSSKIIFTIKKGLTPIELTEMDAMLIDDVHDTFTHQIEIVSSQKEMLTDAITIYQATLSNRLAKISNRINTSIKRLTWVMFILTGAATVLAIPNTVATIFGIPEWPITGAEWRLIALALILTTFIPIVWFYLYWKKVRKGIKQ